MRMGGHYIIVLCVTRARKIGGGMCAIDSELQRTVPDCPLDDYGVSLVRARYRQS